MTGHLNNIIVKDFENSFRTNCMILIGEAYKLLKDTKTITSDWNEENISANIVTNINDNDKAYNYRIIATDESRIYTSDILDNKKSAKGERPALFLVKHIFKLLGDTYNIAIF